MKIAVIGGSGFIGREFSKYAIELDHGIDAFGTRATVSEDIPGWHYRCIDVFGDVAGLLQEADAMVVLAARRPYAGFSFSDYENNVAIAQRCFELAMSVGITNVVFASSKAVYSDQQTMPWSEELCPTPLNLYGASKVAAEQLAYYYIKNKGMAIKCLRLAQVVGMGERKGFLINTLIDNALEGKRQVVYGDGSQRRQYIYIKDVCAAIIAALQKPLYNGLFNIGMDGSASNLELAECVNDAFGNAGNIFLDSSRHMDSFCDEMDVRKAKRDLGFEARYDLRRMFSDLAELALRERAEQF